MDVSVAQNLSPRVEEAIKKVRRGCGALPPLALAPPSPACCHLQVLGAESDELDGPSFDAIEFVNRKFPDEKALEALDRTVADYDYEIKT